MKTFTIKTAEKKVAKNSREYWEIEFEEMTGKKVRFFEPSDAEVDVIDGQLVQCSVQTNGKFINGKGLQIAPDGSLPTPAQQFSSSAASNSIYARTAIQTLKVEAPKTDPKPIPKTETLVKKPGISGTRVSPSSSPKRLPLHDLTEQQLRELYALQEKESGDPRYLEQISQHIRSAKIEALLNRLQK